MATSNGHKFNVFSDKELFELRDFEIMRYDCVVHDERS